VANLPSDFDYSFPETLTVWDVEDLTPDVVGTLLDHNGETLLTITKEHRRIGFV
jgi:hypothetical protein